MEQDAETYTAYALLFLVCFPPRGISTDICSAYIVLRIGVGGSVCPWGLGMTTNVERDTLGRLVTFWWCCFISCGTPSRNDFGNWRDIHKVGSMEQVPIHTLTDVSSGSPCARTRLSDKATLQSEAGATSSGLQAARRR